VSPAKGARGWCSCIAFVVEGGRIARIHGIRNPHKLRRLDEVVELRR